MICKREIWNIYKHLQTFTNIYKHLQTISNIYKRLQTFTNIYKHLQTFTNITNNFKHLQTFTNNLKHLQTFIGLSNGTPIPDLDKLVENTIKEVKTNFHGFNERLIKIVYLLQWRKLVVLGHFIDNKYRDRSFPLFCKDNFGLIKKCHNFRRCN